MVCPRCHGSCAPGARFCPFCGTALVSPAGALGGTVPAPPYPSGGAPGSGTSLPLPPGTLLQGRYRVARTLGSGAFGRVYLAEDVQTAGSPPVAIKELLDAQFSSPESKREAIAWFKREVSTLLTLDHPNIPAIHGYWTAQPAAGPFYLAMDHIPGQTLDEVLQGTGTSPAPGAAAGGSGLPWRRVVAWGLVLCDVLAYLHSRTPPFVFRDLKLPDVMLDGRTGAPVLIDFGIARQMAAAGGTAIGTWGYMPYEQVLGKAETRSDLYALGAMLHTLLTGRRADAEYLRLQRTGLDVEGALRVLFPPADTLVPEVPPPLARALARATAFAPDDRFATAAEMADALREAVESVAPDPPAGPDDAPAPQAPIDPLPGAATSEPPLIVVSPDGRQGFTSIAGGDPPRGARQPDRGAIRPLRREPGPRQGGRDRRRAA